MYGVPEPVVFVVVVGVCAWAGTAASRPMVAAIVTALARGTDRPWSLPDAASKFVLCFTSGDGRTPATIWRISEMRPVSFPNLPRIVPQSPAV